jgi:hypothetical protein
MAASLSWGDGEEDDTEPVGKKGNWMAEGQIGAGEALEVN